MATDWLPAPLARGELAKRLANEAPEALSRSSITLDKQVTIADDGRADEFLNVSESLNIVYALNGDGR